MGQVRLANPGLNITGIEDCFFTIPFRVEHLITCWRHDSDWQHECWLHPRTDIRDSVIQVRLSYI